MGHSWLLWSHLSWLWTSQDRVTKHMEAMGKPEGGWLAKQQAPYLQAWLPVVNETQHGVCAGHGDAVVGRWHGGDSCDGDLVV